MEPVETRSSLKGAPHQIVMLSYNGYTFLDLFKPIIDSLNGRCEIRVVVVNITLSDYVRSQLAQLKDDQKILSYEIIEHYAFRFFEKFNGMTIYDYHKRVRQLVSSIDWSSTDLLLTSCDYSTLERYLIHSAKKHGVKTITLQPTHLTRFHQSDHNLKEKTVKRSFSVLGQQINVELKLKLTKGIIFLRNLRRHLGRIRRERFYYLKWWSYYFAHIWLEHTLMPFLMIGSSLSKNSKYEYYVFTTALTDLVLVYDERDAEAVKNVIPEVKDIRIVQHPSAESSHTQDGKPLDDESAKVLLIIGGLKFKEKYNDEAKIARWGEIVKQIHEISGIPEFHLRFHPRTDMNAPFVKKLMETIEAVGVKIETVDSSTVPLSESVYQYVGVVGAPGSALRTARAASQNAFVLGVPNIVFGYGDGAFDQNTLGHARGIKWLNQGESLTQDHLEIPQQDGPPVNKTSVEIYNFMTQ